MAGLWCSLANAIQVRRRPDENLVAGRRKRREHVVIIQLVGGHDTRRCGPDDNDAVQSVFRSHQIPAFKKTTNSSTCTVPAGLSTSTIVS